MNLIQLKEKAEEKNHIYKLLTKAKAELLHEEKREKELEKLLKKEYKDVQRLEDGGLTSFFYELLGTKDQRLDKERQEHVAARLKLDNCKKGLSELKTEIVHLSTEIEKLGEPEKQYKLQLERKKSELKSRDDAQLLKYEELLQICFSQKKEVKEAIDAGEMALKGLAYAIKSLGNARGWGTVDMIGGGLLTTAIKHSKIDEARSLIQDVQYWLRKFNRELSDVRIDRVGGMQLQLDGFTTFADYFFDNLITDWIVQSKINHSRESCEKVFRQVKDILVQLKSNDKLLTDKYKSTAKAFNSYIEKN